MIGECMFIIKDSIYLGGYLMSDAGCLPAFRGGGTRRAPQGPVFFFFFPESCFSLDKIRKICYNEFNSSYFKNLNFSSKEDKMETHLKAPLAHSAPISMTTISVIVAILAAVFAIVIGVSSQRNTVLSV